MEEKQKRKTKGAISVITTAYRLFREKGGKPIGQKKYSAISDKILSTIVDKIIDEGKIVKFGSNLGTLKIDGVKADYSKKLPLDYSLFMKEGLKNRLVNSHTDGIVYRFRWDGHLKGRVKNVTAVSLVPCRFIKRRLAKKLKTSNILPDYDIRKN